VIAGIILNKAHRKVGFVALTGKFAWNLWLRSELRGEVKETAESAELAEFNAE
jgi:acyl-CoA-binding protein